MAGVPTKVTDELRQQIIDLHAAGLGRNEIAKRLPISAGLVTKVCKELGLNFDRSTTAVAVAARQVDLRARRAELRTLLLDDAHRLRKQMWEPARLVNFGGRDNTLAETQLAEPLFADKKNIMASVGIAVDRILKLEAIDDDAGDAAKSMAARLAEQLGLADD